MRATISDSSTGNSLIVYELHPGYNEIIVNSLENGSYTILLTDDKNDIFYQQRLIKD